MDNSSRIGNRQQRIAGVRLVYGTPPSVTKDTLDSLDYCTRLVMQLKEDELLQGLSQEKSVEGIEMEDLGLAFVEDEEE